MMVVENLQKYHWIQHENTQPVVVMWEQKEIIMNEQSEWITFFLIGTFTLFVYKSLIMVVENFQKCHWIQHKQTQPVAGTSVPFDRT